MSTNRRAGITVPLQLAGLAAVGLFLAFRGGVPGGKPAPSRSLSDIKEFRLVASDSRIESRSQFGELPQPSVRYEVEVPGDHYMTLLEARVVGEGRPPLSIGAGSRGPTTVSFGRQGYPFAPASPRLEILDRGKVLWETKIPDLLPPIRRIPLVVPLVDDLRFRRLNSAERAKAPHHFDRPLAKLEGYKPAKFETASYVGLTEWPSATNNYFGVNFVGFDQELGPLYAFESAGESGFADVYTPMYREEFETRVLEIDLDISAQGVAVLNPQTIRFSDQAEIDIPARTRALSKSRKGEVRPFVGFSFTFTRGFAGALSGTSRTPGYLGGGPAFSIDDTMKNGGPGVPLSDTDSSGNRVELLSPTLEEMGIARLQFGVFELKATPTKPLAFGRHRLKIRIRHRMASTLVRRRFVRIVAQSSS